MSTVHLLAQEGPGWINDTPSALTPQAFTLNDSPQAVAGVSADVGANGGGSSGYATQSVSVSALGNTADVITPEIQALSDGLNHNFVSIYLWVRNNVRYVHYYGCKKGAALTLWERSGNDADQCALLVALLRAAGLTPQYVNGACLTPATDSSGNDWSHWLGVDATNAGVLNEAVYDGGTPRGAFGTVAGNSGYAIYRWWVQLSYLGTNYFLDPSFKPSDDLTALVNVVTQSGYARLALLTSAGGTVGTNSITALNETTLDTHLDGKTQTLLGSLTTPQRNASAQQAFGGRVIRALQADALGKYLLFPLSYFPSTVTTPVDALPDTSPFSTTLFSTIRLQLSAVDSQTYTLDVTKKIAELQGQRLSLTFDGTGGAARVWLDDTVIATESSVAAGSSASLQISIVHPHPDQPHDQNETKTYLRSGKYVIAYGFDPGAELLRSRLDKLSEYKRNGLADTSREVVTENLNVIGLSWMRQTEQASLNVLQAGNVLKLWHHRFGRVSQESSFYVDIGLQGSNSLRRVSTQTTADTLAVQKAESFIWSAMEHGVLAQMQAGANAVSTVKLVSLNNAASQPTYLATNATWSAVRSQLTGYIAADLAKLDTALNATGNNAFALLPKNGSIAQNQWTGAGYVLQQNVTTGTLLEMAISGGLNGGFTTIPAQVQSAPPVQQYRNDPVVVTGSVNSNRTIYGGDPVNLATGQFTVDAPVTLTLDNRPLPRGLSFSMSYDGLRRTNNDAGIGYGWDFNLNAQLTQRSDPENALGQGTPEQGAAAAFGAYALLDVCKNLSAAKDWAVAQLIAKWIVDPLTNNAYALTLNGSAYQFQKLAGSTYAHPTGSTLSLASYTGGMQVKERSGSTYRFNTGGRLSEVEDLWAKKATLTYDTATPAHLTKIKDAYDRSFDFTWSGNQLTTVTDSQSSRTRTVGFVYGTAGDLITLTDPEGKADRFEYDASHHLLRHKTHSGSVIVENTAFDARHRVTKQLSQGDPNRVWNFLYAPGQTQVQDPAGNLTTHQFDGQNRPIAHTDAYGQTQSSVFDGQNHVTQMTTPTGRVLAYAYDANQNVLSSTDRFGQTTQYSYDTLQRLQTTTDPRGQVVTYTYSTDGKPLITKESQSVGGQAIEVNHTYDSATGNLLSTTDADGYATSLAYGTYDRLQTTTLPGGVTNSLTYTTGGDPLTVTDGLGHVSTLSYNQRREPVSTSTSATTVDGAAQSLATSRSYDDSRNLQTETDARSHSATHTYSSTGKLLSSTLQGESVALLTRTYNVLDLPWQNTNALNAQTNTYYDATAKPYVTYSPLNQPLQTYFDADGRVATLIDPLYRNTYLFYDDNQRTVSTTDPLPRTRTLHRDANGNVDTRTNGRNKTWTLTYDAANRLTQSLSPQSRSTTQTFNKRGLLTAVTLPSTKQTGFTYDARGRVQSQTGTGYSVGYTYDANCNPLTVTDTTGAVVKTLTRTYDEVNRVKTFTNESGETLKYLWDENSNLTRLTYPDNKTVTYTYDARNRLTQVQDWASRITTFAWDAANRLTQLTRPNGTIRKLTYDLANRLTKIEERLPNNRIITVEKLTYDATDRLTDRFTVPVPPHWQEPNDSATYDGDNRLLTFNGASVTSDADGNLAGAPTPTGTNVAFAWDNRNRLLSATGSTAALSSTYSYDPEGRFQQLTSNGTTRYTVNPHGTRLSQILVRTDTATNTKTRCVYGLGLLYEERPDGSLRYYHYDQLGSTVALTDASATITGRAHYSPYGGQVLSTGDIASTPFLFNGRYGVFTDKATGLLQMRARFYNPRLKRFLNEDPAGFNAGWNFYAYADGNPVSFLDPFGLGREAVNNQSVSWQAGPSGDSQVNQIIARNNSNLSAISSHQAAADATVSTAQGYAYTAGAIHRAVPPPTDYLTNNALLVMQVGLALATEGLSLEAEEAAGTFEILDGVRRAKAAQSLGYETITAKVFANGEVTTAEVPISKLLSPKSSINVSNPIDAQRFSNTLEKTRLVPVDSSNAIWVQPGINGTTIPNVQFNFGK